MKQLLIIFLLFASGVTKAQELENIMTLSEYIAYVKQYHPLVQQANLTITEGEAKLLKARGAFDPKLEVDYDRKKFKNTEYFDKLNTTFKIPTWFGIEIKGQLEENRGVFLNPEANVPLDGLYNIGVSIPLARNLLTNERMATLKRSKYFLNQAREEQKLEVNRIVTEAIVTYFDWLRRYNEMKVYESFLDNADFRLKAVVKNYELGERAAIDTTEARIALNNRKLNLENAQLNLIKSRLKVSNYLWLKDTPLELQENVIPDENTLGELDAILDLQADNGFNFEMANHPKIIALQNKFEGLRVDRNLKRNLLLPQVDLSYNFLSEEPELINSFNTINYKAALQVSFPLFLRKERGDLRLASAKLQNAQLDVDLTTLALENKIRSIQQEVDSYDNQIDLTFSIVEDYQTLLKAEERKFNLGESSLFLINSRESKLIEAQLKLIEINNKLLRSKAELYNNIIFDGL